MCSAVRMVSRILLRSSSIYEPSDPPSKVMINFSFTFLPWLLECCTGFGSYSGGIFDNPLGYPSRSPGSKPKTRREIATSAREGIGGLSTARHPGHRGLSTARHPESMQPSSTSTSVLPLRHSDEIESRRPWDTDQHAARGTRSPSPPRSLGLPLPASSSIPTLRLGRTPKTRRDRAISNEGIGGSEPPGTLNRWSHPHKHLSPSPLGRDRVSTALGYRSTRGTRHEVSLTTAVSRSPIARVEPHPVRSFRFPVLL